jgi:hypothetical protein
MMILSKTTFSEWRMNVIPKHLFTVMLSIVILSAVAENIVMLSVVVENIVMLSAVYPYAEISNA